MAINVNIVKYKITHNANGVVAPAHSAETTVYADFAAYDQLPRLVRNALMDTSNKFMAEVCLQEMQRGRSAWDILTAIRYTERQECAHFAALYYRQCGTPYPFIEANIPFMRYNKDGVLHPSKAPDSMTVPNSRGPRLVRRKRRRRVS